MLNRLPIIISINKINGGCDTGFYYLETGYIDTSIVVLLYA